MGVTGCGTPPADETRYNGPGPFDAKTMVPPAFHVPVFPEGASHTTCEATPETSIALSFRAAKKPTERLSGDQNGEEAPSVPGRGRSANASNECIQREVMP